MTIFKEIHRRSLWQVLGVYAVAAWVALQVVDVLTDNFGLPGWFPAFALGLMILGLPIVLATAFVQRGGPTASGLRGTAATPFGDPTGPAPEGSAADARAADVGAADATAADPSGADEDDRSEAVGVHHSLFTWRNAILGGVAVFTVLGIVTAGYMAMRTMGIGPAGTLVAKGLFEERDRVILADFASAAADSSLAGAATQAFRVDLAQSEVLTIVEPAYVAAVLARMERPGARLDAATAREVAIREGLVAVIEGDINAAGGGYVLTARVVSPTDGQALSSHRETAEQPTDVIEAIDRLSRQLRERVGESLSSTRADPPLQGATTSSLEALRKYSQAVDAIDAQNDFERGIALLDEALARDSTFAMAWRKLAIADFPRRREAATRAYELRENLTARERYITTATYHDYVTGDNEAAITAHRTLLESYPNDVWSLNNLALNYASDDQFELAVEMLARAVALDRYTRQPYTNLITNLDRLGERDSARAVLEKFAENQPTSTAVPGRRADFAAADRDWLAVEEAVQPLLDSEVTAARRNGLRRLASLALLHGRVDSARRLRPPADDDEPISEAMSEARREANIRLSLHADTAAAIELVEEGLGELPEDSLPSWGFTAAYYALLSGQVEGSRESFESWLAFATERFPGFDDENRQQAEADYAAQVAVAEGRYADALALLREIDSFDRQCQLRSCTRREVAGAFDLAQQPDSAIAHYERWLTETTLFQLNQDAMVLHRVYERLGQLYDEQGDLENAAKYYAMFVELWADADADLQPRVRAAQARLQEIVEARG